jgi:16S rRNA (uracil1498-N3)-methyltransferase
MTEPARSVPRLYVALDLSAGAEARLSGAQSHYIATVMRLKPGDPVRVFNEKDGEWLAYVIEAKKVAAVRCEQLLSAATPPPDIDYVFAPLKHLRLDYVVQKATELGVRRLKPVFTRRTVVTRVNVERMRANVIEAAEQCNLVSVPEVHEPQRLDRLLSAWEPARAAIFCDETAPLTNPLNALESLYLPVAVIIGPEGGFAPEERAELKALPIVKAISLGPRIMRADTAAIAALSLVQAVIGDWRA